LKLVGSQCRAEREVRADRVLQVIAPSSCFAPRRHAAAPPGHCRSMLRARASPQAVSVLSSRLSTLLAHFSTEGKIDASADDVAELLEGSLSKAPRKKDAQSRVLLLTTRREALSLYREVLRYSNLFVWRDQAGRAWRDVIRSSARAEFEASKEETDPEITNRMIITGREAVTKAMDAFMAKRARIQAEEQGGVPGPPLA
jgi:hypothetical protein